MLAAARLVGILDLCRLCSKQGVGRDQQTSSNEGYRPNLSSSRSDCFQRAVNHPRTMHLGLADAIVSGLGRGKAAEIVPQLLPNLTEKDEPFLFGTLQRGRIFEVLVNRYGLARKHWAAFLGVVAHRQDVIERLAGEFIHALGAMARNVDAQLAHDCDRFGPNVARLGPCAEYLEAVARVMAQKAFSHLAPG